MMRFKKELLVTECKKLQDYESLYVIRFEDSDGDKISGCYKEELTLMKVYLCTWNVGDYKKGDTWQKSYSLKAVQEL